MSVIRFRNCRLKFYTLTALFIVFVVTFFGFKFSNPAISSRTTFIVASIQQIPELNSNSTLYLKNGENNKFISCNDTTPKSCYGKRGKYWVLYNYIQATRTFKFNESITYTTHGDWTFLDNLIPLLGRWQGPVSLAIYAPGTDFEETLKQITRLRECQPSSLIKELVTFHILFDQSHKPNMPVPTDPQNYPVDCEMFQKTVLFTQDGFTTFRRVAGLMYPVNVARNVARAMATTFYVLPSDIELYPNPNLIPDFLQMIQRNNDDLQRVTNKVFVLSIFELEKNVSRLPNNKSELVSMLKNNTAVLFHKDKCPNCHNIPKADEWQVAPFEKEMKVFHVGKRHKPFQLWEPIFIGTNNDPIYDERLSWEGKGDKMTQGYALCVLDYEFHILNNAFLVHRPGIKKSHPASETIQRLIRKQYYFISEVAIPELKTLYGTKSECQSWLH